MRIKFNIIQKLSDIFKGTNSSPAMGAANDDVFAAANLPALPPINIEPSYHDAMHESQNTAAIAQSHAQVRDADVLNQDWPESTCKEWLQQMKLKAEQIAQAPVFDFLNSLNTVEGFDVLDSSTFEAIDENTMSIFIFRDKDKGFFENNDLTHNDCLYYLEKRPAIQLKKLEGNYPEFSQENNNNHSVRYMLLGHDSCGYQGGKKATRFKFDGSQDSFYYEYTAEKHKFSLDHTSIFSTEYLNDFVDELVYSITLSGSQCADQLEPLIKTLQEEFEKSYSLACNMYQDAYAQYEQAQQTRNKPDYALTLN